MKRENREIFRAFSLISQIGLTVVTTVFLCIFIGIKIDEKLDTHYFVIVFLLLGVVAAVRNIYYLTKMFYAKDKEKEDTQLRYLENLKKGNDPSDENDRGLKQSKDPVNNEVKKNF